MRHDRHYDTTGERCGQHQVRTARGRAYCSRCEPVPRQTAASAGQDQRNPRNHASFPQTPIRGSSTAPSPTSGQCQR
jgi:hypothetical protein